MTTLRVIDLTPANPIPAVHDDECSHRVGTRVEVWLIVVSSLAMVLLPVLEMALRRLRGSGVPGGPVYVQHLTLWLGFLGALVATDGGKHLGLATASFLKPGRLRTASL